MTYYVYNLNFSTISIYKNVNAIGRVFIPKPEKFDVEAEKGSGRTTASQLIQNFSFSPGVLVIMGLYQILLTV